MQRPAFTSLTAALAERAAREPGSVVLTFVAADGSAQSLTLAELNSRAEHNALSLAGQGVAAGELIALLLPHSPELVDVFWGAMRLGALPAILPYPAPSVTAETQRAQLRALTRRARVHHLLTTPEVRRNLKPISAEVQCQILEVDPAAAEQVDLSARSLSGSTDGGAPAYVQFSSGTTGPQKGILLGHTAVLNNLQSIAQAVALQPQDIVVSWLPLHHDMGLVSGVLLPVVAGIQAVLVSPLDWVKDPGLLFRAIRDHHASICWMPNFAFNHCVKGLRIRDRENIHLEGMRAFYNASEPVRLDSLELFYEHFREAGLRHSALGTSYGMAEVTAAVTISPAGQAARVDWVSLASLQHERLAVPQPPNTPGSIPLVSSGRPVAGVEVRVVGDDDSPLPERRIGEILVLSNARLSGFLGTAQVSTPGVAWVRSGDLGYLAEGELFVTGRIKDLVISGGRNIHPEDIEALTQGLPEVRPGRAVAFGLADPDSGTEQIILVCETRAPLAQADHWTIVRELRRRTQQILAVALADVRLVEAGWIIKTSSGKIARGANRDKYRSHFSGLPGAAELSPGRPSGGT